MFDWLLQNTFLAGVLAAGVAVLCHWRRCTPAVRHALWLLVLIRLAMPPGILSWPWTVPLPSASQAESKQAAAASPQTFRFTVDEAEFVAGEPAAASELNSVQAEPAAATVVAPIDWSRWAWRTAMGLWIGGAVVVALAHLRGLARLFRLMKRGEPAPPWLTRRVAELADRLGIPAPRVRVLDDLASPLVVGFIRPVLLWPRELQDRLNDDGLRAVLLHELAHLRRRDHWVRWLEMAAACVWWWNPLFRLARRRIRQYAELACDAWVLAVLPKARRAYAEALLQVCESVTRTVEPAPALGVGGDRDDFQRRLTMIMRESVACGMPRRSLLAIGILALLIVPGWSVGDTANEPPANPAAKSKDAGPLGVLLNEELNFDETVLNKLLQTSADDDRETKLEQLESQIQAILKEIKALRAEKAKAQAAKANGQAKAEAERAKSEVERAKASYKKAIDETRKRSDDAVRRAEAIARLKVAEATLKQFSNQARATERKTDVTLTRATYNLPHDKGMALAVFLRDYAKTGLSECAVEGDQMTVIAQPGTQAIVGRLVRLVRGSSPEKK